MKTKKILTIHWLKQFLPTDLYIPNNLHLDSLIPPQPTNNKPKIYEVHDDIPTRPITKPPTNNQNNQNDQPIIPVSTIPLHLSHDSTHTAQQSAHPTVNIPTQTLILDRKKRAPYFFTGFFSAITGLATQDSIDTIKTNQNNLAEVEQQTLSQIQLIQTQTNTVIDNIKDQANKLSVLYKDDSDIKKALKQMLSDENNTIKR